MADEKTIKTGEIAQLIKGRLIGPPDVEIKGIMALEAAGPEQVSFAVSRKLFERAKSSEAGALIVPKDWPTDQESRPVIVVDDPYVAYAKVARFFFIRPFEAKGISPDVIIGKDCDIHAEVTIYPGVVIGDKVRIAEAVTLYPGVVLGDGVSIGKDSTLYPNVVVYHGCQIGERVIIHAGAVIGSDGFGYAWDGREHLKIPQVGIVVIEDDVEIGANTTIDRAALGQTKIQKGTKIDNLVQIGHNVTVGPYCILVGQVGIAGSASLGAGVMIGGQAGLVGHIKIGDGAKVAAQAGVAKDLSPGEVVSGTPAISHMQFLRASSALKRLPELVKKVQELQRRLERIEGKGE